MEIKLNELILDNFKGVRAFIFRPNGKHATIRGDNKTGKTTVADGFRDLLFGTDTHGRADFARKTLDSNGRAIPNIEHTTSASLMIDAQHLDLKKVYKEKWTKKRGEAHRQLTSHTTDHFINGVPIPKKEWDARLNGMIDEETFKLLTLPGYFNSLHWEKRRTIVILVAGDVSDADVINSDPKLVSLPEILGDRSLDDHRRVVKAEQKAINGRLKEIPARIDELSRTLPEKKLAKNAIEAYIKHLDHQIEAKKDELHKNGFIFGTTNRKRFNLSERVPFGIRYVILKTFYCAVPCGPCNAVHFLLFNRQGPKLYLSLHRSPPFLPAHVDRVHR